MDKIAKSAVVVADLTLINPASVRRLNEQAVSNPNVLFELGYAFGKLPAQSMVGIFNTTSGEIEELPFDLRPKRLMTYRLAADDCKADVRAKLVEALASAIKQSKGDTEDDQIRRNNRIHSVLVELWLFGTEIEEWYGIESLPEIIQHQLIAVHELPDLMRRSSYPDTFLSTIITHFENASTLAFNDENWPEIKKHIIITAPLVSHLYPLKLGQEVHDELVRRVVAMPGKLDGHLANIHNKEFKKCDLEKLAHDLRTMAFNPLVPQHPQFTAGLKEISLDLRRLVLWWAKGTPKKEETIVAVKDIRERLAQLIDKYVTS